MPASASNSPGADAPSRQGAEIMSNVSVDTRQHGLADSLRLSLVEGIGPRLRKALLERFVEPTAVFDAAPSDLRAVPGIGAELARRITTAREQIDVAAELDVCRQHGIDILTEQSAGYPRALREIYDPPGILLALGDLQPQDALAIAVVGARHATHYGTAQAERLAGSLARAGLTVVSGLARGIDAAAHRGALAAGGRTIAVLGSGLLEIYPPEHGDLARQVCAAGALLSEAPPHRPPLSGAFPQRNRIITGMTLGVHTALYKALRCPSRN